MRSAEFHPDPAADSARRRDDDELRRGGRVPRPADLLTLAGADRLRFLNNLVTCDVKRLAPGDGAFGFVTEAKGHVLADLRVLARDDDFLLVLPPARGAEVAAHLGRYKIVDRVEIGATELAGWWIGGRAAGELVGDLGVWAHAERTVAGRAVRVQREPDRDGVVVATVVVATRDAAGDDAAAVESGLHDVGLAPAPAAAWEALRVTAGWPAYGIDYDSSSFPQETGIEGAVSYDKGCYLGQEVVARIHYRGGVARHLRGLRLEEPVASGAAVIADGREVGRATSVAGSPRHGAIALAVVHRRAADPGTRVTVGDDGAASVAATVVALPFD